MDATNIEKIEKITSSPGSREKCQILTVTS